jgi:hypothetical protein
VREMRVAGKCRPARCRCCAERIFAGTHVCRFGRQRSHCGGTEPRG